MAIFLLVNSKTESTFVRISTDPTTMPIIMSPPEVKLKLFYLQAPKCIMRLRQELECLAQADYLVHLILL